MFYTIDSAQLKSRWQNCWHMVTKLEINRLRSNFEYLWLIQNKLDRRKIVWSSMKRKSESGYWSMDRIKIMNYYQPCLQKTCQSSLSFIQVRWSWFSDSALEGAHERFLEIGSIRFFPFSFRIVNWIFVFFRRNFLFWRVIIIGIKCLHIWKKSLTWSFW